MQRSSKGGFSQFAVQFIVPGIIPLRRRSDSLAAGSYWLPVDTEFIFHAPLSAVSMFHRLPLILEFSWPRLFRAYAARHALCACFWPTIVETVRDAEFREDSPKGPSDLSFSLSFCVRAYLPTDSFQLSSYPTIIRHALLFPRVFFRARNFVADRLQIHEIHVAWYFHEPEFRFRFIFSKRTI